MKKKLVFLFVFINAISYSQDVMNKIAQEACDCIAKKPFDKDGDPQKRQLEFGSCILEGYIAHSSEFPGEKLDFADEKAMGKLGEDIALKMVSFCPDAILDLGRSSMDDKEEAAKNVEYTKITGQITDIKTEQFVSIIVKDDKSRIHTFLLLDYFDTASVFTENRLAKKDTVTVSYTEVELYDPKMKEFRYFKIITGLEKK